jgi:protein-S-isoprenylcysteine O-methyltransferase Ste14
MTRLAVASIAFLVIFTVFTTVFAAAADKSEVRLLPKWVWVLLCLIPFFGGLLYLMVGRPLGKGKQGGTKNRRFVAPDDDPDFLRDLQRKLKKDEDDQK